MDKFFLDKQKDAQQGRFGDIPSEDEVEAINPGFSGFPGLNKREEGSEAGGGSARIGRPVRSRPALRTGGPLMGMGSFGPPRPGPGLDRPSSPPHRSSPPHHSGPPGHHSGPSGHHSGRISGPPGRISGPPGQLFGQLDSNPGGHGPPGGDLSSHGNQESESDVGADDPMLIVKDPDTGHVSPDKPIHVAKPKGSFRPGLDIGLDLMTDGKVQDISDLSSESGPRRRGPGGPGGPGPKITEINIDTSDRPRRTHNKRPSRFPGTGRMDTRTLGSLSDDEDDAPPRSDEPIRGPSGGLFEPGFQADGFQVGDEIDINDVEIVDDNDGHGLVNPNDFADMQEVEEEPVRQLSAREEYQEKKKLIKRIKRLMRKGYEPSKAPTSNMSLQILREELESLEDERSLDASIKWQQKMVMGASAGVELLNHVYNPLDIQLDGWSESVFENLGEYDEIFEELHEKYKDSIAVEPELKLLGTFVGSGVMFHLSKPACSPGSASVPGFEDIMKSDPVLAQRYQERAQALFGQNSAAATATAPGEASSYANPGLSPNLGNNFGNMLGTLTGNPTVGTMASMFANGMRTTGTQQGPKPPVRQPPMHRPPMQQQQPPMHRAPMQRPPMQQRAPQGGLGRGPGRGPGVSVNPNRAFGPGNVAPVQAVQAQAAEIEMPDDDDILGSMSSPATIPIMEDLGSESGSEEPVMTRRTKRAGRMGSGHMRAVAEQRTATPITVR